MSDRGGDNRQEQGGDKPQRQARERLEVGVRLFVLSGCLLAVIGFISRASGWMLLTSTVGPTAYVLLAHPTSAAAKLRSALIGHGCAIVCGLGCLAAFSLWNHPSVAQLNKDTPAQVGAQAVAVGATLLLLTLLDAHHPPAAATALLITSGIARPGPLLSGMLVGLAAVLAAAFLLARVPGFRQETGRQNE
jgi:hypothetical protein